MSQAAEFILIGVGGHGIPRELLIKDLDRIEVWDNGNNHPIRVKIDNQEFMAKMAEARKAILGDGDSLIKFIESNVKISKNKTFKYGGKSELMLVDHPDRYNNEGHREKKRSRMTHLTPKKKKRKKR